MKANYKLKFLAAILFVVVSVANANALNPVLSTTINVENPGNWVEIQNENGITVFYSKSDISGNTLLGIKFTNTNEKEVTFNWTVTSQNGFVHKSNRSITLKPGESFTETGKIEMKGSMEYVDYPINLTIK
ncbi:MAG: hypothetical protein JXR58_08715 [Bacteroidales bacterium]|nr:hypothetical protein [Bacteroidales bacterium]